MRFLDFSDKVVFVSGSTRGIGKETARFFAECGARVIVNCRHEEETKLAAEELQKSRHRAIGISADMGNFSEVNRLVEKITADFGRLDVVVNNAVYRTETSSLENLDISVWHRVLQNNLTGMFYLSKTAIPLLKKSPGSAIINFSSGMARSHIKIGGVSYAASKGAVISFTRSLAQELREYEIRVNALAFPLLVTDRKRGDIGDGDYQTSAYYSTLGLPAESREIAHACAFLASPLASYINGNTLVCGLQWSKNWLDPFFE